MKTLGKVCYWIYYILLLILGIGQMPSTIGALRLLLAVLTAPRKWFLRLADYGEEKVMLITLIVLYIRYIPVDEISAAGTNMGRFLYTIWMWIQPLLNR